MSTGSAALASEVASRRAPGFGGFNATVLRLEVRRLLRNRRTVIITIIFPVAFFLIFGLNRSYANNAAGHGNVSAFVMISLALYGAVFATTIGGAMVSLERSQGWSRQLRLTPLSPAAYITIKVLTALVLGLISVVVTNAAGLATHKPSMPGWLWIVSALCVWIGSLLFAAFGLFLGYLLPSENVMQLIGLILSLLSFAGGLFIPLSQFPSAIQTVCKFTPLYGLNQLVHAPLLGSGVPWTWPVNVLVWLAIFSGGAIWLFRRDTARV
jgi:ABC-2 type transport system permease protein